MRKFYSAILLPFIICSITFGQSLPKSTYKINPTIDSALSGNIYVPANLYDCFHEMDKMLTKAFIVEFKSTPTEKELLGRFRNGLGLWIKENWGLWDGSRLSRHLQGFGIRHPDRMAAVILTSYWRRLNDLPIGAIDQMPLLLGSTKAQIPTQSNK